MDTEPAKGEQPPMKTITIYHNPKCGTSRNVLALIRNSGVEPEVIEYLKTPPTKARLAELGLGQPHWSDDQLLDFMLAHPILINRPLVVSPLGVKLCRPSETVLDILPNPQQAAFAKEDGEQVVDAKGQRLA